eukprot:CAMPEP_0172547212 /NCGR_PEP_ID=MMETSP1067-20121228/16799_1 /TAXON_ID=265564 ORGANISM="Thalassiosira punctigera, Strain Tpunct2005C2" /NCGR_SAMPLE_ID=MMETSP1067 /ASSEMBLY_ACC=CAM_ASM_000444 /LENGTH=165 /DNA_ID=CAMNT_0013334263 /DNA_START=85 /DNA_END=583 /DNA_ORIENTATION=+
MYKNYKIPPSFTLSSATSRPPWERTSVAVPAITTSTVFAPAFAFPRRVQTLTAVVLARAVLRALLLVRRLRLEATPHVLAPVLLPLPVVRPLLLPVRARRRVVVLHLAPRSEPRPRPGRLRVEATVVLDPLLYLADGGLLPDDAVGAGRFGDVLAHAHLVDVLGD